MIPKNLVLNFDLNTMEIDTDKYNKFAVVSVDIITDGNNLQNIPFTPESIDKAVDSLVDSPLVVDMKWGQATTHSKDERSVGFFKNKEDIQFTIKDGKRWLSSKAYIWKKYATDLIDYLQQHNGSLPVSMEIKATETEDIDGLEWVTDFEFIGVTILGATVQEAVEGANMQVLSFAQLKDEFNKELEFSNKYKDIDFSVPEQVKKNIDNALDKYFKNKLKVSNFSLDIAKELSEQRNIGVKHVEDVYHFFEFYNQGDYVDKDVFDLWGGLETSKWVFSLFEKMKNADKKEKEEKKPVKKDNKDIKKEEEEVEVKKETENFVEDKDKVEEDADETADGLEDEDKKDEDDVDDEDDDKDDKDVDMSLNENADAPASLEFLDKETKQAEELAQENLEKDKAFAEVCEEETFASKDIKEMAEDEEDEYFEALTNALGKFACVDEERFAKLDDKQKTSLACKMAKVCEMAKDANSVYLAKKKDLYKFKLDFEAKAKEEKVEFTLGAVKDDLTTEQMAELRKDAQEFSFAQLGTWENLVKAKAYEFSKQKDRSKKDPEKAEDEIKRFAWSPVSTDSNSGLKW